MLRDYFGIASLQEKLELENSTNGFIKSYFGRNVILGNDRTYLLLNYYIQSTAVDAALFGFKNLVDSYKDKIKPLFLLHDALIAEVKNNLLKDQPALLKAAGTIKNIVPVLPCKLEILHD